MIRSSEWCRPFLLSDLISGMECCGNRTSMFRIMSNAFSQRKKSLKFMANKMPVTGFLRMTNSRTNDVALSTITAWAILVSFSLVFSTVALHGQLVPLLLACSSDDSKYYTYTAPKAGKMPYSSSLWPQFVCFFKFQETLGVFWENASQHGQCYNLTEPAGRLLLHNW